VGLRPLPPGELPRKVVHIGSGLFALALRFLGPLGSAAMAAFAILFNFLILPRVGGKNLLREGERGRSIGILLYPISVFLLIVVFWRHLEVAAAGWGLLAFGDGMASVVGLTVGGARLPWNPKKSWSGTLAFVLFGGAAACAFVLWTAPGVYSVPFAAACCFVAALVAAALESQPQGLDDNLGVPMVASLFLLGLLLTQGRWADLLASGFWTRAGIGFAINAAFAAAAYAARSVDRSGVIAGTLLGTAIYAFLDWRGFLLLVAFFVIGTACTKLGYQRKAAAKLAQEAGGRRGARHAFANAGVAAACALFVAATPYPILFGLAFAGAFATAASDTAGSEIGQLLGRRTFKLTTLRPVPRGTEGAVSLEGTLAGILASLVIGGLGYWVGLYPAPGIAVVAVAASVGTTFESLVGGALERSALLDNEALNFLNTLVGALVAASAALVGILGPVS
jgi:uncharacterized protein (TIGR00297 family)